MADSAHTAAELPLSGTVVVELGDSASAPFSGQVLAALGAEVWKVERPGAGDSSRGWGPSRWRGSGAAFHALNRGKRSIGLDLKDPAQLSTLHDLIERHADVFLHNLRPGSAAQYGLDAASLRARKPRLVCSELGAFGDAGPLRTEPGYDPMMQAFAGIMGLTGEEGQAPVRAGVSIIDFGAGLWLALGTVAALLRRERSGHGAAVSGSLLETAMAWMSINIANHAADGDPGGRHGSGVAIIVPHRAYAAADGHLVVSAANDRLFARLAAALGHPEWAADPKFSTNAVRLSHRREIDGLIGHVIAQQPRAWWQDRLSRAGLPCAPVQTVDELVRHPQAQALGLLDRQDGSDLAMVGLPLSFDGRRPPPLAPAPDIGQHDAELWRALGRAPSGHADQDVPAGSPRAQSARAKPA
ncbi:CaiB/BaiF CoA transferase family protein [Pseudorhodoferax sp.]|uniref:CaiB/BaiF CoA transferase family protein n=1 Tax=Pseudorhodoferax sp. TaxID=1993553 RepID=UPI002DD67D7F|nr:CoA transferase [Pseudorhodoferax sp.]